MQLAASLLLLCAPVAGQSFDPVTQTSSAPPLQRAPGAVTLSAGVGDNLYASEVQLDRLHVLETVTVTSLGSVVTGTPIMAGISTDPLSNLIWVTDTLSLNLETVDPATGASTVIGFTGITLPHSLAISPDTGRIYCASWTTPSNLYELDRVTGVATLIGSMGLDYVSGLDFDPLTGELFGNTFFGAPEVLFTVDPATAATTVVGTSRTLNSIAFDASGDLFGVYNGVSSNNPSTLFSIDKLTAAWVEIGDTDFNGNVLGLDAAGSTAGVGTAFCAPAVANSTGAAAEMTALGSAVALDNNLTLRCGQMPPNQFGYFLNSMSQGFIPNAGGSQGNLCLALPIGRYSAQLGSSGAQGVLAIQLDLPNTPQAASTVAIVAGQTWHFQCWYRDTNPGPTSNFSNGWTVVFQ